MKFVNFALGISLAALALWGCPQPPDRDFRGDMRELVIKIANQARSEVPDFIVIPQNGQELLTTDGQSGSPLALAYTGAIDGQGREDLFYGYVSDNVATPAPDRDYLLEFLDRAESAGIEVLVTDYCSTPAFVTDSYDRNAGHNFISFAAHRRELDRIPPLPAALFGENADDITSLAAARNFLYLINPGAFASRSAFLDSLTQTNHDLLIIDAFFDDTPLSNAEVAVLKTKANGGTRLVIAYMSIGEAEDYRYYWHSAWRPGSPEWIEDENPFFDGNFIVRYWDPAWQAILLDGPDAYLNRIVAAGFDGVYLDLIDAFEYFE